MSNQSDCVAVSVLSNVNSKGASSLPGCLHVSFREKSLDKLLDYFRPGSIGVVFPIHMATLIHLAFLLFSLFIIFSRTKP